MPLPSFRRVLSSAGAVLAGLVLVAVLSLGTDQVLHDTGVYPPMGQPMMSPWLNALALGYRFVFTVAAGYLTARLAPGAPMRHVWVLAMIGLALATLGAIATVPLRLSPAWMPITLALTALPLTWLGGAVAQSRTAE
jgi:hypothetical protein